MNDRDAEARQLLEAALGRKAECPEITLLARADSLPEIQEHLEGCTGCRAELALIESFSGAEPGRDELVSVQWIESELRRRQYQSVKPAANPHRSTWWERFRAAVSSPGRPAALLVAAAAIGLVFTGSLYFRRGAEIPNPRPPDPGTVWRSSQFSAVSPSGAVTADPREFRWEPVRGAVSYRLELLEADGTPVWSGSSSGPSLEIPEDVRGMMRPGRAFQWQVTALNAAGESITRTDLQKFRILPTSR